MNNILGYHNYNYLDSLFYTHTEAKEEDTEGN